jgi:hypothetical protein
MKVKVKVEPLGNVITTAKGYLREFLYLDPVDGQKGVLRIFSKNSDDLTSVNTPHERIVETDNFCFALKN